MHGPTELILKVKQRWYDKYKFETSTALTKKIISQIISRPNVNVTGQQWVDVVKS